MATFKVMKNLKFLALTVTLAVTAQSMAFDPVKAKKNCERIYKTYNACGKEISVQGESFYFPKTNTYLRCTDGRDLKFYERMNNMDMASIFQIPYETGVISLPEKRLNNDPGRLRAEDLLKTVYGESEDAARKNLVTINFLGHQIKFQKKLGAAKALQKVSDEIEVARKADPSISEFLKDFLSKKEKPGTFNWRVIAGTNRLSLHSFGIAIDMVVPQVKAQYWLWDEKERNPELAKQGEVAYENIHYISQKTPKFHPTVVKIFESNGFIWGGKWNHYDTMHFEYRPEFYSNYKINCP
jgi:hypothetical protein